MIALPPGRATPIEALRHTPPGGRVVLLAYNAHIAKELSRRVSGRAHVRTLHSLGLAAMRSIGGCVVDEKKTGRVLAATGLMDGGDSGTFREMLHLVSLAKGLEAERVFILRPDLMPLSRARQAWEQQQERNIEYVAYTRSKSALYFVEEGE